MILPRMTNVSIPGDVSKWYADISKVQSIGFQQKVALDEGLQKTIDWLVANRMKGAMQ